MSAWLKQSNLSFLVSRLPEYVVDPIRFKSFIDASRLLVPGPHIASFHPWQGHAGCAIVITGYGFSEQRAQNVVEIGGRPAYVLDADANRLVVLCDANVATGPVRVTVDGLMANGPRNFELLAWPAPSTGEDGPPYSFSGRSLRGGPLAGGAAPGDVPPTGVARVLVVPSYPTDMIPADLAATRQAIVDTFGNVRTYYDQVSYQTLDVQVDVIDFVPLLNDAAYYHRPNGTAGYPNIDNAVLDQLMAEAAQGAVDAGNNLDNYVLMAVLVYLPGLSVRAWGGWSATNFAYNDGAGVNINIVTANPVALIAARHDADWGRAAHEFGHALVDGGLVLGEDVYASDLVDASQATVQDFELMGNHDSHPLFSGFFMHQLGYYSAANIVELQWDRNPFSAEYDLVAHGLAQDAQANRYHLIRIKVSDGLAYVVEVRQRPPDGSAQVFDANIPLPMGTTRTGGVVVTKAITGELNTNQQTRLITLLHDPRVQLQDDVATDPLRALTITVVDDQVAADPLVCRVRVEWAQQIADTPGGDFDLRIDPWNANYETPDIWIDRLPYGTYDFTDPGGNPTGNGDEPRPLEINHYHARVHNDGSVDANNVRLTFYAINPPGVGDNGNWAPLGTQVIPLVATDGSAERSVNWIPVVGEHTCLKAVAEMQLGEVAGANNSAQENVFTFQPAASVADPVVLSVAIRNPLKRRALVRVHLDGVPVGYRVYFPHRWVYLDALGERRLDLVVIPLWDIRELKIRDANVRLFGSVDRGYSERLDMTGVPGSWMTPIGGLTARVMPKHHGTVRIEEDRKNHVVDRVAVVGQVTPNIANQQLRVDMTAPNGSVQSRIAKTDGLGRFGAIFGIKLDNRAKRRAERPVYDYGEQVRDRDVVVFEVQAHVFNASQIAPMSSNIVRVYR